MTKAPIPLRVYFISTLKARDRVVAYGVHLAEYGFEVTTSWTEPDRVPSYGRSVHLTERDWETIEAADCVVVVLEEQSEPFDPLLDYVAGFARRSAVPVIWTGLKCRGYVSPLDWYRHWRGAFGRLIYMATTAKATLTGVQKWLADQ